MVQRHEARRAWSVANSIRTGLLVTAGALSAGVPVGADAFAQTASEISEGVRHVDLRASRLHAGSTAADVERILGNPSAATKLGGSSSGDTAFFYSDEPVRTRIVLNADRVSAIALDIAYVDPAPLPARARVVKATMVRSGVIRLLGAPNTDQEWKEAGRSLEQMVFAQTGEPEFSVFLCDGLVSDVKLGRDRPPNLTSVVLPTAVPDASANGQLALGLTEAQVAQLIGPPNSTTRFAFKNQPIEYAAYHRRGEQDLVTATFMGGILTAFEQWPSDES